MGSLMDIRKMCAKMVYTKIALVFTSCKSIQGTGTNDCQMNTYTLYSIPMASHAKFTNMWPKEGELKTGDGSVSFVFCWVAKSSESIIGLYMNEQCPLPGIPGGGNGAIVGQGDGSGFYGARKA